MRLSPPIEPLLTRSMAALPLSDPVLFEQRADDFRVIAFTGRATFRVGDRVPLERWARKAPHTPSSS
ncbi:hypothetical protein Srubr_38480 [Streptomyces rubradiris]|uniref:Uncharacterized protein n=1 Tax=Streptomyces rubradiris TaxID=285531 RepID=A0ABQ3RDW5_STRRR|nr:hypothetical protein GCM10018792_74390 [Streptomyces rubradiris]GHI54002.1 hypothetical protein Srubr_38480 [Streptomyces rubradiris]